MKIKYMVMQSPIQERIDNVKTMAEQIPGLVIKPAAPPALLDQYCDCFMLEQEYDGLVLLEDDAILCKDFVQKIEAVIEKHPNDVISIFEAPMAKRYLKSGYYPGRMFSSTLCNYIPKDICPLIYDKENRASYLKQEEEKGAKIVYPSDTYTAWALKNNKLNYWMEIPFLVQHHTFESTFKGRSKARVTSYFIDDYHPPKDVFDSRICVGYTDGEKEMFVKKFLSENPEISGILYFSPTGMKVMDLDGTGKEIMRKTFFEAMCFKHAAEIREALSKDWLIIYDECMRVKKRNDLTYHSFHHYGHIAGHQIVFETFPMISDPDDFLILIDMAYPNRYLQKEFTPDLLDNPDISIHPRTVSFQFIPVPVSDEMKAGYETEKGRLFDNIGDKNPNTIPANLALWTGTNCKKKAIGDEGIYIARNSRFKKKNVKKYTDFNVYDNETYSSMSYETHAKNEYIREFPKTDTITIVDFPIRDKEFVNMIKFSGASTVKVLDTGLSIDSVEIQHYTKLFKTMEEVFFND